MPVTPRLRSHHGKAISSGLFTTSFPILSSTLQQLPGASPEPLGAQSLWPEATLVDPLLGVGGSGHP